MSHKDAGFWKGMAVTFLFGICLGIGMANLLPAENLKQHSKITVLLENGMSTESMETRFLWIFPLRMRLLLILILAGCAAPFRKRQHLPEWRLDGAWGCTQEARS